jgi:hypothetical protein
MRDREIEDETLGLVGDSTVRRPAVGDAESRREGNQKSISALSGVSKSGGHIIE